MWFYIRICAFQNDGVTGRLENAMPDKLNGERDTSYFLLVYRLHGGLSQWPNTAAVILLGLRIGLPSSSYRGHSEVYVRLQVLDDLLQQ